MNYVMSDIHGNYNRYIKMLKQINLSDNDTLYILGDVLDRGEDGVKILQDMMLRPNIIPIIGNHEYMAYSCMKLLMQEVTDEFLSKITEELMQGLMEWMNVGGETTINDFRKLSPKSRREVISYIAEFEAYEIVDTGNNLFILVHAGLDNFSPAREMEDYDISELVFNSPDYCKKYFTNAYLVTGHLPTREIRARLAGKTAYESESKEKCDDVLKINNHIAIDCGCGFDGKLGCLCLETMEEYYEI